MIIIIIRRTQMVLAKFMSRTCPRARCRRSQCTTGTTTRRTCKVSQKKERKKEQGPIESNRITFPTIRIKWKSRRGNNFPFCDHIFVWGCVGCLESPALAPRLVLDERRRPVDDNVPRANTWREGEIYIAWGRISERNEKEKFSSICPHVNEAMEHEGVRHGGCEKESGRETQ